MRRDTKRPSALVTGGAKGIGRAIALALADDGYDVGIVTRQSEADAKRVIAACKKRGAKAQCWVADLTDIDAAEWVAADFVREYARWDVLVNNVGDYWAGPVLRMTTDTLRSMFQSNLSVAVRLSLLAIKSMQKRKSGRIVNIGYVFADRLHANPRVAAYQAAKTAMLSFSHSLAVDAMRHGITINVVSPGVHHNTVEKPRNLKKLVPAGRMGQDADIIGAVRYFLSPEAGYITGSHIKVSGGYGI